MVNALIEALSNQLELAMKNNDSLTMTNSNLNAELEKVGQENNQLVITARHMSERVAVLIQENADLHQEIADLTDLLEGEGEDEDRENDIDGNEAFLMELVLEMVKNDFNVEDMVEGIPQIITTIKQQMGR